jgi:hypothetical protein
VIEASPVEVIGWSEDSASLIYTTEIDRFGANATIGTLLHRIDGPTRVLVRLWGTEAAARALRDELTAAGVSTDAIAFWTARRGARSRFPHRAHDAKPLDCRGQPFLADPVVFVDAPDPADLWWSIAPDGGGFAQVAPLPEGATRVQVASLPRTLAVRATRHADRLAAELEARLDPTHGFVVSHEPLATRPATSLLRADAGRAPSIDAQLGLGWPLAHTSTLEGPTCLAVELVPRWAERFPDERRPPPARGRPLRKGDGHLGIAVPQGLSANHGAWTDLKLEVVDTAGPRADPISRFGYPGPPAAVDITFRRCAQRPRAVLSLDWVTSDGRLRPAELSALADEGWLDLTAQIEHETERARVAMGPEVVVLVPPQRPLLPVYELVHPWSPDHVPVDIDFALSERPRTVVYTAPGWEGAAAALAAKVPGGASVEPLTWSEPRACLVVALGDSAEAVWSR